MGRGQKDQCNEYDGVSYPGTSDCPNCVNSTTIDGTAPDGEFIIPGGTQSGTDPYSGTTVVPGSESPVLTRSVRTTLATMCRV